MTEKTSNICLLGASFNTGNMGVSALAAGTIKSIINTFPNANIFLLDYGKEKLTCNLQICGRYIPIPLMNIRFSKRLYLKNNIALLIFIILFLKLIPFKNLRKKLISKNTCLSSVLEADFVVSISGGDSFSDIYGIERFLYVSLPQLLVIFMGKKLIILPQTLGPYKSKVVKCLARYILNHASVIYSRDHQGLIETKELLNLRDGAEKLRFCYDVGFVVDPVTPAQMDIGDFIVKRQERSTVVGLNVSGLLFMGGYKQKNMFGLKINYKSFVYRIIEFLIKKKGAMVLLIPHVFGSTDPLDNDSAISEKIFNDLKSKYGEKLFLAKGVYNQSEIKYIIGLCNFFIGSRMHACIAALSQCIPSVGIAYSKKFKGVFQSIGLENLVADPRTMTETEILDIVENVFEKRNDIKDKLEMLIPSVQEKVLNIFKSS